MNRISKNSIQAKNRQKIMCNVIFQGSSYGVDCRLEGRTEKHTSLLLYAHSKPSRPSNMRSRREKPKKEEKIHLKSPNVQHLFL